MQVSGHAAAGQDLGKAQGDLLQRVVGSAFFCCLGIRVWDLGFRGLGV